MGTLPHRPGCPWSILLPPTGRWLWGQPVSEDGIFVQCPLVTCWLFDLDKDGLVGSPCNPRDSQESSPTPKFIFLGRVGEGGCGSRQSRSSAHWMEEEAVRVELQWRFSLLITGAYSREFLIPPSWYSSSRNLVTNGDLVMPPLGKMRPLPATASQGKSPVPP